MNVKTDEIERSSLERYYQDFDPAHRPLPRDLPDNDIRAANALEYAAYQLGQISRKLDQLMAAKGLVRK